MEDEKKKRYYRHIHEESERLSRLIQNVLTLAQLEKKEWQSNLSVLNPTELVREVVERLANQIKDRHVDEYQKKRDQDYD